MILGNRKIEVLHFPVIAGYYFIPFLPPNYSLTFLNLRLRNSCWVGARSACEVVSKSVIFFQKIISASMFEKTRSKYNVARKFVRIWLFKTLSSSIGIYSNWNFKSSDIYWECKAVPSHIFSCKLVKLFRMFPGCVSRFSTILHFSIPQILYPFFSILAKHIFLIL